VGFENRSSVDIRSSGLVNGRLIMCRGAAVVCKRTDSPTMDCPDLFGSFLTARIGVSVGRLPQEVLSEEFYRSECSESVRIGRIREFGELPTVFNCSVLTFWSAIKFHRE
jgi:hypothetical protein